MRGCATGLVANAVNSHSGQKTLTMQTLVLLVAIALACALARPPAVTDAPQEAPMGPKRQRVPMPNSPEFLSAYPLPRYLMPHDLGYEESAHVPDPSKTIPDEINMINQMSMKNIKPYDQFQHFLEELPPSFMKHVLQETRRGTLMDQTKNSKTTDVMAAPPVRVIDQSVPNYTEDTVIMEENTDKSLKVLDFRDVFAFSPIDPEYYDETTTAMTKTNTTSTTTTTTTTEAGEHPQEFELMEPRQPRQNPNWGKTKTLVASDIDLLRTGLTQSGAEGTATPHHVLDTSSDDPDQSIYGVALLAAIGAAITVAILGFAFGWYTLTKRAKAAAEVEYPAYGVTGPTVDHSGDRKLAQSAHMYHYQHQKQQIIAMERSCLDDVNGSVSDPDSEEDNEEGDYTVYECPGFATTGNMEVKNPMFKDDATPAPANGDAAKSQSQE